jgi:hypothetical protein
MVEYPARPRISAMHTAATIAGEGTAGVEVAELTVYLFRVWDLWCNLPIVTSLGGLIFGGAVSCIFPRRGPVDQKFDLGN